MKRLLFVLLLVSCCLSLVGCYNAPNADSKQSTAQEKIQAEIVAQLGIPNVKNAREARLVKDLIEMRDREGITTYLYVFSQGIGKWVFIGESIGYPVPYSTQYTSPSKIVGWGGHPIVMPQAEPNGLYSPSSAEGSWAWLKDPNGKDAKPAYFEERINCFPFRISGPNVIN